MLPSTSIDNKKPLLGNMTETNFPKDSDGRTYHLGLKAGEVANNILLVGDPARAELIKSCFDDPEKIFTYISGRGFTTYTGTKNGKLVTIISMGMGMPMMDFTVRELRAIIKGPLNIIRLGSCGTPHSEIEIKTIVVARESFGILTNYDAYHGQSKSEKKFKLTLPIKPDEKLTALLFDALKKHSKEAKDPYPVCKGTDATADTFYAAQGRIDPEFDDQNEGLIEEVMKKHPDTGSLQMETYHLFHLAKLSKEINAAACAIVLAQRKTNAFLTNEEKHKIELDAGNACLEVLAQQG